MAKRVKYIPNAPLEKGDKVVCIKMFDDYSAVAGGTPGVVKSVSNVMGVNQYYVDWRSGSRLALIEGEWITEEDENIVQQKKKEGYETRQKPDGSWEWRNGDTWRKVVEVDDEESESLTEGFMFFTTKRAILKETKK
jgi:hypothetical protein